MGEARGFPGEREAIDQVLRAGARYGYGNMMSHLSRAWAERLIESGLAPDVAALHVSSTSPYPIGSDFPFGQTAEDRKRLRTEAAW